MPRLIDLSRVIEPGMITDPRLPTPAVRDVWTRDSSTVHYAPGVSFQIASIDICQNTGTYLDAPFHRHATGEGVWNLPIERVACLPGMRIDMRGLTRTKRRAIEPGDVESALAGFDLAGVAVLLWTGFDELWNDDAYRANRHPFISASLAEWLVVRGVAIVGLDAINADDTADLARPAHTILLGAGTCIVENLVNLGELPDSNFRFTAAPIRAEGLGSFPVRAFAELL